MARTFISNMKRRKLVVEKIDNSKAPVIVPGLNRPSTLSDGIARIMQASNSWDDFERLRGFEYDTEDAESEYDDDSSFYDLEDDKGSYDDLRQVLSEQADSGANSNNGGNANGADNKEGVSEVSNADNVKSNKTSTKKTKKSVEPEVAESDD